MKKWLFLILLFPLICVAQTYRYLGVEDGLSNRRVYCIQKDKTGYMWFLTHVNPEKPDVPLNKNDAFQKVQKRRVQEKR